MLLQLSAYAQYIFPFGNIILPIVIWNAKKNQSEFVNRNGKQAINFQLSVFVYFIGLLVIAAPVFAYAIFNDIDFHVSYGGRWHFNMEDIRGAEMNGLVMLGIVAAGLGFAIKVAEFILILIAALKNGNGENFKFPLTINFIK